MAVTTAAALAASAILVRGMVNELVPYEAMRCGTSLLQTGLPTVMHVVASHSGDRGDKACALPVLVCLV